MSEFTGPLGARSPLEQVSATTYWAAPQLSLWIRLIGSWSIGRLLIERLPIPHATTYELRPFGYDRQGIGLLWQKAPT
jgi:hypothetical protein